MNESEKSVYEYLTSQGLGTVVYEPDGNVPPDFLVDGRIAVEVRRLNQNEETTEGHRGLEEISKPLHALVRKALAAMGPSSQWNELVRLLLLQSAAPSLETARCAAPQSTS
jgi:hypothetical protein